MPSSISTLITAGDVLNICEEHGDGPRFASVRGITAKDIADFRSIVRDASLGELVHCPWTMAQQITFVCVRERTDASQPLFTDARKDFEGIDQDEWSRIVD